METSPAFFEGKSERRVRVFLESGFCTGPSPGPSPVRVSQYAEYKASRNKVNIALRQAKADYYRNKIATQNNNHKEAWKTINSLLGRSPSDTSVNELKVNDAMLTSPGEIAEAFNTYFSNVGPTLANSMADSSVSFEQFVKPTQSKMLRFKLVPYSKVLGLLNSLSKSKATGLDKISGKILKAAACSIASSLTYIFNHALISCHFPSE